MREDICNSLLKEFLISRENDNYFYLLTGKGDIISNKKSHNSY